MRKITIFIFTTFTLILISCGVSPIDITATANISMQKTQTAASTKTSTPTLPPSPTLTATTQPTPIGGGGSIVFISASGKKGDITFYDIATIKISRLNIQFPEDVLESLGMFGTSSVSASPDGTKLAFIQNICPPEQSGQTVRYCFGEMFTSNIDGSNVIRLTRTGNLHEEWPVWSPDGKKIAYISDIVNLNDLCVINSDGSSNKCIDTIGRNVFPPTWSPDGTKIAFSSQRNGPFQIYVINANGGGNLIQLTQIKDAMSNSPSWSPDGLKIVFRVQHSDSEKGMGDIFIMDSDGSNQDNLTDGAFDEVGSPTWSPDGRLILFSCNGRVCTMRPDGTGIVELNKLIIKNIEPTWFIP